MRKGERTRRMIVAKSAQVFNQHGYKGTSLSDLMTATGLQKGGIYRHFLNKEELAAEAFDFAWKAAAEARMRHVNEQASGLARLKVQISNVLSDGSTVAGGCPLLKTAAETGDGNPLMRARVTAALRSWIVELQTIIDEAAGQGEFRPGIDAKAVANVIVAAVEGALMISRLERNDEAVGHIQRHLFRYVETDVASSSCR